MSKIGIIDNIAVVGNDDPTQPNAIVPLIDFDKKRPEKRNAEWLDDVTHIPINGMPTYDAGHAHRQIIRGKNARQTRNMVKAFKQGLSTIYGYVHIGDYQLDKRTVAVEYAVLTSDHLMYA